MLVDVGVVEAFRRDGELPSVWAIYFTNEATSFYNLGSPNVGDQYKLGQLIANCQSCALS